MALSDSNRTPLGKRSSGSSVYPSGPSLLNPSYIQSTPSYGMLPPVGTVTPKQSSKRDLKEDSRSSSGGDEKKRKRKSRWSNDETEKAFIPGMPTILPTKLNKEQEEAYLVQLQIEELNRKLRSGDLGIPVNPEDRSPSPEPIYSSDGKRLNTREYRTRKKLEEERHKCVVKMQQLNPDYKPPVDYKPPFHRVTEKVMIPQEEYPDINFVGLLIGPRGNTLKSLEKDSGAKIIIRGKGSVKEGKVGHKDGKPLPGEDEPLHAYVTANKPESVKTAVEKIKEILRQAAEVPEEHNDLRKMQLRELALLNGTLREGSTGPRCNNCGATDHKAWQCPDKPNVTNQILCIHCGGSGHVSRDCQLKKTQGFGGPQGYQMPQTSKIDEEYMSLMAELGEGPPPPPKQNNMAPNPRFQSSGSVFQQQGPPRSIMPPQIPSLMSTPINPRQPFPPMQQQPWQYGGNVSYPNVPPPPGDERPTMAPPGSGNPGGNTQDMGQEGQRFFPPRWPPQMQQNRPPPPMVPPPPWHQENFMGGPPSQQSQTSGPRPMQFTMPPNMGNGANMFGPPGIPQLPNFLGSLPPPPPPPSDK